MTDMSWKDAIITVLQGEPEPMHYSDIAEAVAEQGLRRDIGATPAASVAATISISMQNEGEDAPFVRVSRGYYALKGTKLHIEPGRVLDVEEDADEEASLINAFGMYWRRGHVFWATTPQLLGQQQPSSKAVDFCDQKGVYLLQDGVKVVYVGRAIDQSLGARLKQHTVDRLNGRWNRFSWFGVYPVNDDGTLSSEGAQRFTIENLIVTMEALLIEGLEPPQNRKRGDDFRAVEFIQVEDPKIQKSHIVRVIDELKTQL